jgi:hypothetical protein
MCLKSCLPILKGPEVGATRTRRGGVSVRIVMRSLTPIISFIDLIIMIEDTIFKFIIERTINTSLSSVRSSLRALVN